MNAPNMNIRYALSSATEPEQDGIRSAVADAFAAITSVHKLPTLKERLTVRTCEPQYREAGNLGVALGYYRSDKPGTIFVNPEWQQQCAPEEKLTGVIVHEFMHLMDNEVFGTGKRLATESGPGAILAGLGPVLSVLIQTRQLQALVSYGTLPDPKTGQEVNLGPNPFVGIPVYQYLANPAETLARAYFQYITTKTGQPDMKSFLDGTRAVTPFDFWSDEEFEPVAAEFDTLFDRMGLLVKPQVFEVDNTGRVTTGVPVMG